jgi:uncharacterized protein YciI
LRIAVFLAVTRYKNGRRPPQPAVEEHWNYLDDQYAAERVVCSGPQASGTGGVILLCIGDGAAAREVLDGDPLVRRGLVTYDLMEFQATRAAVAAWIER